MFLSPFAPENLVSRDGFGSPVPRQPTHLHTQAEYSAYSRDSSRVPRWRPFIYLKPPYAIESVPSLSGHAIAYRWRSLPRVRRHRASKPQGSSERVLPWQVTMDQLICTCWYCTYHCLFRQRTPKHSFRLTSQPCPLPPHPPPLSEHVQIANHFGTPLKVYGRDNNRHREGRRNYVEHVEHDDPVDGSKRTRVRFNMEGPNGHGMAYAEVP